MSNAFIIRPAETEDMSWMAEVAEASVFPGKLLPEMMAPYLKGDDTQIWHVAMGEFRTVGFTYVALEPMTDRVWNLKAIAVGPDYRGFGAGRALLRAAERVLVERARLLVIDTTDLPDQEAGRNLYASEGYAQGAAFPDFWEDGAAKVTFFKRL